VVGCPWPSWAGRVPRQGVEGSSPFARLRGARATILVGSDVVQGAMQAITGVLFAGLATVWNVALLQTGFGAAAAFSRPATIGIVRDAASDARLQEANALIQRSWVGCSRCVSVPGGRSSPRSWWCCLPG
jgi:hypothetical protein